MAWDDAATPPEFRRKVLDLVEAGRPRLRPHRPQPTVGDRHTEHPTREGKLYCAVVLDAFSRRVVGWSIDASPTAALVIARWEAGLYLLAAGSAGLVASATRLAWRVLLFGGP